MKKDQQRGPQPPIPEPVSCDCIKNESIVLIALTGAYCTINTASSKLASGAWWFTASIQNAESSGCSQGAQWSSHA